MKPGTKIEFKEETKNLIDVHNEINDLQSFAIETLFRAIKESDKRFFNRIRELHPELNGYHFRINYEKNTITVMYKIDD